jgi:hypothetical protein
MALSHFTRGQIMAQIEALLEEEVIRNQVFG